MHVPISDQEGDLLWFAWGLVGGPPPLHNAGFAVLGPVARGQSHTEKKNQILTSSQSGIFDLQAAGKLD